MAEFENKERDEIFSKIVRAGKRTYFFDVKSTRNNDHYITVTESKKRFNEDGTFIYEKHKMFLYKEDFDKFFEGLTETIGFIKNLNGTSTASPSHSYASVSFEDLGTEKESVK